MRSIRRNRLLVEGEPVSIVRAAAIGPRRGSILVPPLIGGSGLQQIRYFPDLRHGGYEVVSFDYRGHARSGGRFSIGSSLVDTEHVLRHLERESGPLFGMGDCYGAIPLLWAARRRPAGLQALALFNPVPSLQHMAGPLDLLRNYFLPEGRPRWRNPLDLKAIVAATNERLFPEVDKSRDHFGILDYGRARTGRVLAAYLLDRCLTGLRLPDLPALVVYGRSDEVLRLHHPESEARYLEALRHRLPRASFHAISGADHFMRDSMREGNELTARFFDEARRHAGVDAERAVRSRPLPAPPEVAAL